MLIHRIVVVLAFLAFGIELGVIVYFLGGLRIAQLTSVLILALSAGLSVTQQTMAMVRQRRRKAQNSASTNISERPSRPETIAKVGSKY